MSIAHKAVIDLLAWAASLEGTLSDASHDFICAVSRKYYDGRYFPKYFCDEWSGLDPDSLRHLMTLKEMSPTRKTRLLEQVVELMVFDKRISTKEVVAFTFVVDLLELEWTYARRLFRNKAGIGLPDFPEQGSCSWWRDLAGDSAEMQPPGTPPPKNGAFRPGTPVLQAPTVAGALVFFGLRAGFDPEELHHLYREMIKKHHPDNFYHLGDEYIAVAREKMLQINAMYEVLRSLP